MIPSAGNRELRSDQFLNKGETLAGLVLLLRGLARRGECSYSVFEFRVSLVQPDLVLFKPAFCHAFVAEKLRRRFYCTPGQPELFRNLVQPMPRSIHQPYPDVPAEHGLRSDHVRRFITTLSPPHYSCWCNSIKNRPVTRPGKQAYRGRISALSW